MGTRRHCGFFLSSCQHHHRHRGAVTVLPRDPDALRADLSESGPVHAAGCCLATPDGGMQDSWRVDYSATLHTLQATCSLSAAHFVLLSPLGHVCLEAAPRVPGRQSQVRVLPAEAALDMAFTYSIIRPTAFFKIQIEVVKKGSPYGLFGHGKLYACKPISEGDFANFMANCIFDNDKRPTRSGFPSLKNRRVTLLPFLKPAATVFSPYLTFGCLSPKYSDHYIRLRAVPVGGRKLAPGKFTGHTI